MKLISGGAAHRLNVFECRLLLRERDRNQVGRSFYFSKMYFFIRGCNALLTYTIVIAEMDMNGGLKISSNMFVNV